VNGERPGSDSGLPTSFTKTGHRLDQRTMRKIFARHAANIPCQACLFVAVVAAAQCHDVALGQDAPAEGGPRPLTTEPLGMTGWRHDPVVITTPALGMTGWRRDPIVTITTPALGMAGWRRDPVVITTPALGLTGWQRDPVAIAAPALGMTGWRHDPVVITTPALAMTGWAGIPEQCSAPFVRDDVGGGCICPPGLLPSGDACIAAGASPPADLRVEEKGPDTCEAGKSCPFDILVTNVGAGPFHGPLIVRDEVNLPDAQMSTTSGGWSCAAGTCVQPGATLAPGESETLTVNVLLPSGARRNSQLQHCAELKLPEPGDGPIRFVQLMLAAAGIDAGPADNQMGPRTRGGIETFRQTAGLPNGSDIDEPLIAALRRLMPVDPQPQNDRNCTEARITG
jgi:hypothetical protein